MSSIAVDTSVLLSIFKGEESGAAWLEKLETLAASGRLVISPVVMAELRSFFPTDALCLKVLKELDLSMEEFSGEALLLAGGIFRSYRKHGGPRSTILPDFLVVAHAAVQTDGLASEDRGYLRKYFPKIKLIKL